MSAVRVAGVPVTEASFRLRAADHICSNQRIVSSLGACSTYALELSNLALPLIGRP